MRSISLNGDHIGGKDFTVENISLARNIACVDICHIGNDVIFENFSAVLIVFSGILADSFSIDGKLLDFRVLLIDDGKITTIVLRENTAKYPVAGNGSATHSDLLSLFAGLTTE